GNVTMTDVAVQDEMVTGVPVIESLAPGETSVVVASEYTVTAEDAAAGEVLNTATAAGMTPAGDEIASEPDVVQIPAGVVPGGDGLATTGADITVPLLVGGSLLLGGIALTLLIAARRRTNIAAEYSGAP